MKQTVQESDFLDAFRAYGRDDQFTRAGLCALFDYLEEYEASTGEELELDVIALCCDWSEYKTALEAARDNRWDQTAALYDEDDNERPAEEISEKLERAALEWLNDRTTVIEFDGGVIVWAF